MADDQSDIAVPQFIVGKVLLFRLESPSTAVITDARFELVGGRVFAVGVTPWGSSPGFKDKTLAIAWDLVREFYLFDSVEEWQAASLAAEKAKQEAKSAAEPKP